MEKILIKIIIIFLNHSLVDNYRVTDYKKASLFLKYVDFFFELSTKKHISSQNNLLTIFFFTHSQSIPSLSENVIKSFSFFFYNYMQL